MVRIFFQFLGKHIDKASYRTYCLMGDGESMEGNVWEALNFAGKYNYSCLLTNFWKTLKINLHFQFICIMMIKSSKFHD